MNQRLNGCVLSVCRRQSELFLIPMYVVLETILDIFQQISVCPPFKKKFIFWIFIALATDVVQFFDFRYSDASWSNYFCPGNFDRWAVICRFLVSRGDWKTVAPCSAVNARKYRNAFARSWLCYCKPTISRARRHPLVSARIRSLSSEFRLLRRISCYCQICPRICCRSPRHFQFSILCWKHITNF